MSQKYRKRNKLILRPLMIVCFTSCLTKNHLNHINISYVYLIYRDTVIHIYQQTEQNITTRELLDRLIQFLHGCVVALYTWMLNGFLNH